MLIRDLELASADPARQYAFYAGALGLPVLHSAAERVLLAAGRTRLQFVLSDPPAGSYHFAFSIPENQFEQAAGWLAERTALLRDASGNDRFYSESWDAHSVYAFDPDGNIIELIARHRTASASDEPFGAHRLLQISEIGITADDVEAATARLCEEAGITIYDGAGSATFTAIGDEEGLFIVVRRGRIWHPDTGRPAAHLPIGITTVSAGGTRTWRFPDHLGADYRQ